MSEKDKNKENNVPYPPDVPNNTNYPEPLIITESIEPKNISVKRIKANDKKIDGNKKWV